MTFNKLILLVIIISWPLLEGYAQRSRELGIHIGVLTPGKWNAITDVDGVLIGQVTKIEGDHIRTGVTAILPYRGNIYQTKVPAAMYIANGYGKLMGYSQVEELGNIETPIVLTNTLSVPSAANGVITHTLRQEGNERVRSVNAIVGETNDGRLNDIRGRHISENDVLNAISNAKSGPVEEGNVGAGTGTIAFGFKGGIGTASRKLPTSLGGYTVGVLVQTNFGGVLEIDGIPIGESLKQYSFYRQINEKSDGSCMIVVATDAPLDARNLKRLAKRAMLGLGKTGGIVSNGSGDYVIAFSTAKENLITAGNESTFNNTFLKNSQTSPLFMAVIESTEEAIINALFAAKDMVGHDGYEVKAIPKKKVLKILKKHRKLIR